MTTQTITTTYLDRIINAFSKALMTIWIGIIASGEAAGRARAVAQLTRMGYHEEAKKLMSEVKT